MSLYDRVQEDLDSGMSRKEIVDDLQSEYDLDRDTLNTVVDVVESEDPDTSY